MTTYASGLLQSKYCDTVIQYIFFLIISISKKKISTTTHKTSVKSWPIQSSILTNNPVTSYTRNATQISLQGIRQSLGSSVNIAWSWSIKKLKMLFANICTNCYSLTIPEYTNQSIKPYSGINFLQINTFFLLVVEPSGKLLENPHKVINSADLIF